MTSSSDDRSPRATLARLGDAGALMLRLARGGRPAAAYLLDGPDPARLREASFALAAALLCPEEDGPCGACSTCRRVSRGTHPDAHRQGKDKATVVSVEALSAFLERAHSAPHEAARQVFTIDPADAMAPEAIGRYLKTLEEPSPTATFVLVTSHPDRLPDTVRSRCQRVRLPPRTEDDVAAALRARDLAPERARRLAHLSGGSLDRAERLADLRADEAIDALRDAARARPPSLATAVEAWLPVLRTAGGASLASEARAREEEGDVGDDRVATAGEAMRAALLDVLHAMQVEARDAAAAPREDADGEAEGDAAAAALVRLATLSSCVRRNVSPFALLLEAARCVAAG